jgi:hypothetical protein
VVAGAEAATAGTAAMQSVSVRNKAGRHLGFIFVLSFVVTP